MKIRFMKYRVLSYVVSGIVVGISILSLVFKGLNFGIDFAGGILMDVKPISTEYTIADMRKDLAALNPVMQSDDKGQIMIRVGLGKAAHEAEQNKIVKDIKTILGQKVEYKQVQVVGPRIGGELVRGGMLAIIFAFAMMAVYIWIRYRGGYAAGALISIILDAIIMFGFFSVFGLEFSQEAIAVILTGVGYSINDKVVNYDRIEENSRKYRNMSTSDLIDLSVNEMLARTLKTSTATMFGMLALMMFAGNVLGEFALAMLFSIVAGTLTSIYIANVCLIHFNIRDDK